MPHPAGLSPADQTLRAFGWTPKSDTTGLHIDGVGGHRYQVGRAWSPDGTYRTVPKPNSVYVTLSIEGEALVDFDGRSQIVQPNQAVFLDGEATTTIHLHSPVARYLWRFDASMLRSQFVRGRVGEPIDVAPSAWKPLTSLTNTLVIAPPEVTNSVHAEMMTAQLLTAIFDNRAHAVSATQRLPDRVYSESMHVIDTRSHDPTFNTQRLAADILVSERTLRRVFARMGTTPRQEIERRRLISLRASQSDGFESSRSFEERAARAGFTSGRQARQALRRQNP